MRKPLTYARASKAILDYILQFAISRINGDSTTEYPRTSGSSTGFVTTGYGGAAAQIGDLVLLTSANAGKWRLSWLDAVDSANEVYTCRSIEDQELCDWSNVGLSYFHRKTLDQHQEWKWSDQQFEFNDKWRKACFKWNDAYRYLPCQPEFSPHGTVTIGVRQRHGITTHVAKRDITNWQKVTLTFLSQQYNEMVEEFTALHAKGSSNV
jgi:hypothetical protein